MKEQIKAVLEQFRKNSSAVAAAILAIAVAISAMFSLSQEQTPVYGSQEAEASGKKVRRQTQNQPENEDTERIAEAETETGTEEQITGSFDVEDGTYTGSAKGFSGPVTVQVTVRDDTITAITVTGQVDDAAFFCGQKKA